MERRNRLQTESHFSAHNLAFMFGLLESCKLNKVNFGEYIEDGTANPRKNSGDAVLVVYG